MKKIKLTAQQKEEIRLSRKSIKDGDIISTKQLNDNFKRWLKE